MFNVVGEYGHPNEKEVVKNIKQKYESGKGLEFDDLKNIDDLYKSNIEKFSNKKDD